jgi:hypothetical protein
MKLKGLGRTLTARPKQVRTVKTRFGCRVYIDFILPVNLNGYELEKLADRIRTALGKD